MRKVLSFLLLIYVIVFFVLMIRADKRYRAEQKAEAKRAVDRATFALMAGGALLVGLRMFFS